jgi:hypothetical protein
MHVNCIIITHDRNNCEIQMNEEKIESIFVTMIVRNWATLMQLS